MRTPTWALGLLLLASAGSAAESPNSSDYAPQLEAVVVSGVQPGPGLWRVSHGEHVMWVLGTLSPLPKRMQWDSQAVRQIVAESQEVLMPPSVSVEADSSFLGVMMLVPSMLGARKNPEQKKLVDVLPAELYTRWLALKRRYIGWQLGIEKRRPIFAAHTLYEKAISRSGLSAKNIVLPQLTRTAKRHDVTITRPKVEIKTGELQRVIEDFASAPVDDIGCFRKTLERIETDLEAMKLRANAWATGDLAALEALPFDDQNQACTSALLSTSVAQNYGFAELPERLKQAWLAAAEAALEKNAVSFATLPIANLLKADGYLALLEAKGYQIHRP